MQELLLFLGYVIINFIAEAMVVGIAFFALFGHKSFTLSIKKTLFILFVIFWAYRYSSLPFLDFLDIRVTFGNKLIADALKQKSDIPIMDLLGPTWSGVFKCLIQSIIAHYTGLKVYQRISARLTPGQAD